MVSTPSVTSPITNFPGRGFSLFPVPIHLIQKDLQVISCPLPVILRPHTPIFHLNLFLAFLFLRPGLCECALFLWDFSARLPARIRASVFVKHLKGFLSKPLGSSVSNVPTAASGISGSSSSISASCFLFVVGNWAPMASRASREP